MKSHLARSVLHVGSGLLGGLMLFAAAPVSAQSSAPDYAFVHLAGSTGGAGSADGPGSSARFHSPSGPAVDGAGNVYVADTGNHTIRRISPSGVATVVAGAAGVPGSADGTGADARFFGPNAVALDSTGNLFVADRENHTIRRITPGGVVTTVAGSPGNSGSADGTGSARFSHPGGVAVDSAGNIYVGDTGNYTVRKIATDGAVTTLAGLAGSAGRSDGTGLAARFFDLYNVAVDSSGNVYAADFGNSAIRKITPGGAVTTLPAGGGGGEATLSYPTGVATDSAGNVYVADKFNSLIRKITPGGVLTTLAGRTVGSADGIGAAASFYQPSGVTVDSGGNVYVTDTENHTVRKITPSGVVTTLAGQANVSGSTDGTGVAARFLAPSGVAVGGAGQLYVADQMNNTIRLIAHDGIVTTVAGAAGAGSGSTDGSGTAARFSNPLGLTSDSAGNIYVADASNHTIRKITPGFLVTTLAGTAGVSGSTDDTGVAARFNSPRGLATDSSGNIYVADTANHAIRRITPGGVVTTVAGTAGVSGSNDGTGASARFNNPEGVTLDAAGNIYVADTSNDTVRKISPSGTVTTLAGSAGNSGSADGTGTAARFFDPRALTADAAGNLYVVDAANFILRKITPGGVVTTLAGRADFRGCEDGIGVAARFNFPGAVAIDSSGSLFVADTGNNCIRKGQVAGLPVISTQPQNQVVVAGNNVQFSVAASAVPAPTYQWYFNGSVFSGATSNTLSFANARSADAGDYTVVVTNSLGSVTSNKATLTISAAPSILPSTSVSGGGGGSLDSWFVLALLALGGATRWVAQRNTSKCAGSVQRWARKRFQRQLSQQSIPSARQLAGADWACASALTTSN